MDWFDVAQDIDKWRGLKRILLNTILWISSQGEQLLAHLEWPRVHRAILTCITPVVTTRFQGTDAKDFRASTSCLITSEQVVF
jgi:hypothetical protein